MAVTNAFSASKTSPYSRWRMLVVTPDYESLRKMQRLFAKRFQRIEFEMDGATARDRIKDIFAPSFKLVVVDQRTVTQKEANSWKATFEGLEHQPVLMLMTDESDSTPARLAATMGCVGIIDIHSPGKQIVRQMLVSTGHLAPEPDELLFDESSFTDHASELFTTERMQSASAGLGQFTFPKCPALAHEIKATYGKGLPALHSAVEQASEHTLLGKALARASDMVFRFKDTKRMQIAAQQVGAEKVRELLLIATLQEAFSNEKHAISGFELKLWRMAIATGKAFEALLSHYPDAAKVIPLQDALIAGIAANSGMILLYKKYPNYIEMVDYGFQWDVIGSDQCAWENRRYGIDSALLSFQIVKNWRMKTEFKTAVQHLHNPTPPSMTSVAAQLRELLIIANTISCQYLYNSPNAAAMKTKQAKLAKYSKLDKQTVIQVSEQVTEQMAELTKIF